MIKMLQLGYEVIIIDNLHNSSEEVLNRIKQITGKDESVLKFEKVDLRDQVAMDGVFEKYKPEAVIHFAALKAVGESVEKPLFYYDNNVAGTINLLKSMEKHNCKLIVFSSSACCYGENPYCKETDPTAPLNPYGQTKVMCETILQDFSKAHPDCSVVSLRYFNPIGAHQSGMIGEDPKGIPNNLLPYVQRVSLGQLPVLNVFGTDYPTEDGSCIRDFIHVVDLADGHIICLERQEKLKGYHLYNLGTGKGTSVLELIAAYEKANNVVINKVLTGRRAGDAAKTTACVDKVFEELGWKTKLTVEDACRDTGRWAQLYPNGFGQQE